MTNSRRRGYVLAAATLSLTLAVPLTPAAQSLASVQGFVSDDTGASLPGVTIDAVTPNPEFGLASVLVGAPRQAQLGLRIAFQTSPGRSPPCKRPGRRAD